MSTEIGLLSVDDHVLEHGRVWTDRMSEQKWGARIPHIARQSDGSDAWVIDGMTTPLAEVALVGALMSDRALGPADWSQVPAAAYDPRQRLRAMNSDAVDVSVLYPTVAGIGGQTFGKLSDAELELDCVRAYNDWLVEEWAQASPRFVPQCLVPLSSIESAVAEVRRAVAIGHRGVVMPGVPMLLRAADRASDKRDAVGRQLGGGSLPHINEPDYDPLWAVCAELEVPLCFHSGSTAAIQMPPYVDYTPAIAAALEAMTRPVSSTFLLANFLFSGILNRHPGLKVVFAETTLAWGAYTLESADHQFERQRYDLMGWAHIPSELFRRQCYLTGWYDRTGLDTRAHIGVDNMLWCTNFPQATGTWPLTGQTIERCFNGVPDSDRRRILWENASALYRVDDGLALVSSRALATA